MSKRPELPQMSFVKGGTTTAAHDRMKAQQFAEAERRRNEQASTRRAAQTGILPEHLQGQDLRPDAPGVGRMTSLQLGGRDHASVVLEVKHPKDNKVLDWQTCELTVQPKADGLPELMLLVVCMRCITRGVKMGDAQIKMVQSNRMFWLDERRAGDLWVNPNDPNEVVTLAGTITTHDWCHCPQCDWTFRIDNSVLYTR
jgi:hypothetical protein